MDTRTLARRGLLGIQALVAVTALAGGIALIAGSLSPGAAGAITADPSFLAGSPFADYLIPGILLAVVIGGMHAASFVLTLRRVGAALFVSAATAFGMLIWIFVQIAIIPFSPLQAVYFALGLAECGLIMVALGLFAPVTAPAPARAARRPVRAR